MLTDQANIPDTDIWDEDTGETFGEARARFATFGPVLTAEEVLATDAESFWSFGYGDDPTGFTTIDREDLQDAFDASGNEVDGYWGPFVVFDEAAPYE